MSKKKYKYTTVNHGIGVEKKIYALLWYDKKHGITMVKKTKKNSISKVNVQKQYC